jgi:nucleotide-binding universal stress UspA family protein
MFKHLLVPLDGSRLAESALPAAAYLAQTLNARVTLIHVIEHDAPIEVHRERHLSKPEEACQYLDEIAARAFPASLAVETHVHTSEVKDVARSIVEHSGELQPDLIVMCSHGSGGLRDRLFGSIAQQIIAAVRNTSQRFTPVLLVRPGKKAPAQPFKLEKILLPLDGKPEHEQGVPVAAGLAQACGAALHLAMVVPTLGALRGEHAASSRLLPGSTAAMLELAESGGQAYLQNLLPGLQAHGLVVTGEVARGDPASTVAQIAERIEAGLIVLGTHGKAGTDAFWSGSFAARIADKTFIPLLLVPVRES